jgi:hypothetical protein
LASAFAVFAAYTVEVLRSTGNLGIHRYRDMLAMNMVNMAYILGLPRIVLSYILGLIGVDMEWRPTPKGSSKWSRPVTLVPESAMTMLVTAFLALSVVRSLYLDSLILLPYTLLYLRGLGKLRRNEL